VLWKNGNIASDVRRPSFHSRPDVQLCCTKENTRLLAHFRHLIFVAMLGD